MSAAVLAELDALPQVPCMAPVPWPRASVVDEVHGLRWRRVCKLPNGHQALDVPCLYDLVEERVAPDATAELGEVF